MQDMQETPEEDKLQAKGHHEGLERPDTEAQKVQGDSQMTLETTLLKTLAEDRGALKKGNFTLSSGITTQHYFDAAVLTMHPETAGLIGRAILPHIKEKKALAVGGPPLGAVPIAMAVAFASVQSPPEPLLSTPVRAFTIRRFPKDHGTKKTIEGNLPEGLPVAVVDDTCTTGLSLLEAILNAEAAGHPVVKVIVLMDRQEGGSDTLRNMGYDFTALLKMTPDGTIETGP